MEAEYVQLLGRAGSISEVREVREVLGVRGVHPYLYGVETRPGRKIGHVTALGDDLEETRARVASAAARLTGRAT